MPLRKQPRLDDKTGFLHVAASLTRAPAVFLYRKADGTTQREFRPEKHVMAPRNLDSIRASVVTNDHPPVRVTTRNARRYQVGQPSGNPSVLEDTIDAELVVTDDAAIADLNEGKREISLGYDCDLVLEPGVWTDGEGIDHPYDAIQTNHETNHIAIVNEGRAGSTVRVHMDETDAIQVDAVGDEHMTEKKDAPAQRDDFLVVGGSDKARVTIDGIEIELSTAQAQAVSKAIADAQAKADAAEAAKDAAVKERDDAKAKASPETISAWVDARIKLNEKARPHFDEAEWAEARKLSDNELRRRTVAKANPQIEITDKSDDYIAAAFDLLAERDDSEGLRKLGQSVVNPKPTEDDRTKIEKLCNDHMREDNERWRKPVPGGFTRDGFTANN
jgi:hypothetical protein